MYLIWDITVTFARFFDLIIREYVGELLEQISEMKV